MKQSARIPLLDELRGFAILAMVLYHLVYDLSAMEMIDWPFFHTEPMKLIRDLFAGLFIMLSGLCCLYSRSNLRRGVLCYLAGVGIEWVTSFIPGSEIRFGILHMLGSCMVLFGLAEKWMTVIPSFAGLGGSLILFLILRRITNRIILLPVIGSIPLPDLFYSGSLYALGLPNSTFFSADYYPLIPWGFLFFGGYYLGRLLQNTPILQPGFPRFPFLSWCGRHSLWIYLLHQPAAAAGIWIWQILR
ncbi:MAG: heparan-alpha-glucosaminide N-acetyltransferase [Candidatus Merdivicinus sp.]|jgi:uncharacterized membrane protein